MTAGAPRWSSAVASPDGTTATADVPDPEHIFAPVHRYRIEWNSPVTALENR